MRAGVLRHADLVAPVGQAVHRDVVDLHADAGRAQSLEGAPAGRRAVTHADREQVVAVQRPVRRGGGKLDALLAGQQLAVAGGDLVAARHPAVEALELATARARTGCR